MIKKILFPIILILAVILGGVSADYLRNRSMGDAEFETSRTNKNIGHKKDNTDGKNSHKSDKKKKKGKKNNKKGGHDAGDKASDDGSGPIYATRYMKFKRQFVVPVMSGGRIESLALLNINLELSNDAPENAYTLEPKLRDAIMRELLALSHEGAFSNDLTSADTYDRLRHALLKASQSVMNDGVVNVLILDLMRQDQ